MNIFKLLPVLSLSLFVGACGTLISGQTQNVTLLTPGANDAECTFDNGVRYTLTTGETISVMRNKKDIKVECYAPGDRHRKLVIENDGNKWSVGNVATGILPGIAFDHFSGGLYEYPEVITVDFVGVPTKGFELPQYHNKDAPNPYTQAIESYSPSTPKLQSDGDYLEVDVTKKTRNSVNPFSTPETENKGDAITPLPGVVAKGGTAAVPSKSGPMPIVPKGGTAEELNRSMNPNVFRN